MELSLQRNSLQAGQPPSSPFGAEPEDDDADVQEVEMVLETYFMHIDNTYNKLQTLTEYIDDTEVFRLRLKKLQCSAPCIAWQVITTPMPLLTSMVQDYINIELDNQRNQLIRVRFVC